MELNKLKIEYVDPKSLEPAKYNPRTWSEEALKGLRASISEFGIVAPFVINKRQGLRLVGGHMRCKVAIELGIEKVPIVYVDLDDKKEKALNVALNSKYISGSWDASLGDLLGEIQADLPNLFDNLNMVDLLADVPEIEIEVGGGETDADKVPEVVAEPVIQLGDLVLLNHHRLLCGDSTRGDNVTQLLDGISPILMVTDPPYGVKYDPNWRNEAAEKGLISYAAGSVGTVQNDERVDWSDAFKLANAQVCYVWHAGRHAKQVQQSLEDSGFIVVCQIIWAKPTFAISRGDYHWQHEPCWYAVKKGSTHNWQGDRSQSTLWEIERGCSEKTGHGTEKPILCMQKPIENNTGRGDLVYDPFLGSGTTMIAAEQLGRVCCGMEISPAYVEVSTQRWINFTGKPEEVKVIRDGQEYGWAELQGN